MLSVATVSCILDCTYVFSNERDTGHSGAITASTPPTSIESRTVEESQAKKVDAILLSFFFFPNNQSVSPQPI